MKKPGEYKIKTPRGGYKSEVSTCWNSKLTTKRRSPRRKDSTEAMYKDVSDAYHAFWARRRDRPDTSYWQK